MLHSHNQKINESTGSETKRVDVNKAQKPQPVSRQPSTEPTEAVKAGISSSELEALREKRLKWIQEMKAKNGDGSSGWDDVELDGGVFELHSAHLEHSRTRIISDVHHSWSGRGMGIWQKGYGYPCIGCCYWKLTACPWDANAYTITNVQDAPNRIARTAPGSNDKDVGLHEDGFLMENADLWYIFKGEEHGKYQIFNYVDFNAGLHQWGNGHDDWGTHGKECSAGDWCLTPRFKIKLDWCLVRSYDNRAGSEDIQLTITEDMGVIITNSDAVKTRKELKTSMKRSVHAGIKLDGVGDFGASADIENMIDLTMDTSMTSQTETDWKKTTSAKYTVPAGKNWRLKSIKTSFQGLQNKTDDMDLLTGAKYYRIDESDGELPDIHVNCPARKAVEGVDFTSEINE